MGGDITDLQAYRRSQGGAKAQAFGDLFEKMFKAMCQRNGIAVTRFPSGCRWVGKSAIPVKTPFDWIITHKGKTALVDTKTSEELTFPHSKITSHQISEMVHHEVAGTRAGYVIWLRKSDCIVFVGSLELEKRTKFSGSVRQGDMDVRLLGTPSYFDVRLLFQKKDEPTDAA